MTNKKSTFKRNIIGVLIILSIAFQQCTNNETPATSASYKFSKINSLNYTILSNQLEIPWQIAFAPDGRFFITERKGLVRIFENGTLKSEPWLDLRDSLKTSYSSTVNNSGLLGITIDPNFDQNGYVYLGYSYEAVGEDYDFNKLVRYKENSITGLAEFDKILLDKIKGRSMHNSGQIKFGPDKKIYWTIGDRGDKDIAQDLNDESGSILRLNPDGSIPPDNPFPHSYIYAYGLRNSQGFSWHPKNHRMLATEHGPTGESQNTCCYDEINIIQPGKNYGWPLIKGNQTKTDMELPLIHSDTGIPTESHTWAPSGATFVRSGPWEDTYLFAGLRSQSLWQIIFDKESNIKEFNRFVLKDLGRIRSVEQHPNGAIYIITSNLDGLSEESPTNDFLVKIEPSFPK